MASHLPKKKMSSAYNGLWGPIYELPLTYITSLTSSATTFPFLHMALDTLTYLLLLEHSRNTSVSGSLHSLFSLLGIFFPQISRSRQAFAQMSHSQWGLPLLSPPIQQRYTRCPVFSLPTLNIIWLTLYFTYFYVLISLLSPATKECKLHESKNMYPHYSLLYPQQVPDTKEGFNTHLLKEWIEQPSMFENFIQFSSSGLSCGRKG